MVAKVWREVTRNIFDCEVLEQQRLHVMLTGVPSSMQMPDVRTRLRYSLRHNKLLQHVTEPTACNGACAGRREIIFLGKDGPSTNIALNPHQTVTFGKCRGILVRILRSTQAILFVYFPIEVEWASSLHRIFHGNDKLSAIPLRKWTVNPSYCGSPVLSSSWWILYGK